MEIFLVFLWKLSQVLSAFKVRKVCLVSFLNKLGSLYFRQQ